MTKLNNIRVFVKAKKKTNENKNMYVSDFCQSYPDRSVDVILKTHLDECMTFIFGCALFFFCFLLRSDCEEENASAVCFSFFTRQRSVFG